MLFFLQPLDFSRGKGYITNNIINLYSDEQASKLSFSKREWNSAAERFHSNKHN